MSNWRAPGMQTGTGPPAVSAVRRALDKIATEGIEATTEPYEPTDGTRLQRALLGRFRVRHVEQRQRGGTGKWWQILVLDENTILWGPAPGEPGRDQFVKRAAEVALRHPTRTVVLADELHALVDVLSKPRPHAIELVIHEICAVASIPRAADSTDDDVSRFRVPLLPFELEVRTGTKVADGDLEQVRVSIVDRREPRIRQRDLAAGLTRRRVAVGSEEAVIRTLPPDDQAEVWQWLRGVVPRRRATPNELGVTAEQLGVGGDVHPALRGVRDLGEAHGPELAGIPQHATLQAVVLRTRKGFQLRTGYSTSTTPFWKQALLELEQERFKPGPPGGGHYSREFITPRLRRLGMLMVVGWQGAAGLPEASNSAHISEAD